MEHVLMYCQVASDHVETIEKLARILQRIVASLNRYSNYEILFKNNLNTQRAIGTLYSDLIDLCTRVVRFHSRSALSTLSSAVKLFLWLTLSIRSWSVRIFR
jgi:hypothetical protein